jgi:tetratricopeptide (TPR) repeat protein
MQLIRAERPEQRALVHGIAAILLHKEGRSTEAESEYLKALDALEKAGQRGADAASTLTSLGSLYINQGRLDEAARMLDRALEIFNTAPDTVPLDRIKLLYLRAALHAMQGEWQKAQEELRDAISIADQEKGLDPAYYSCLLANYAQVLRKNHRRREARPIEARAAALRGHRATEGLVDVTELSVKPTAHNN